MQEIADSFKNYINERLNSPLIASYVFAWVIFNYRVPVLLVSDVKVHVKLAMIDTYLHGSLEQVLYVYGWPAVIASVYVFIAPIPTTVATAWTLLHQNFLAKVQQVILRRRIVTEEELAEREAKVRDRVDVLQQKLHEAEERVGALRLARETAEAEARDLQAVLQTRNVNQAEIAKLSESLTNSALQLDQVKREHNDTLDALAVKEGEVNNLQKESVFVRDIIRRLTSQVRDDLRKEVVQEVIGALRSNPSAPAWIQEVLEKPRNSKEGLLGLFGDSKSSQ